MSSKNRPPTKAQSLGPSWAKLCHKNQGTGGFLSCLNFQCRPKIEIWGRHNQHESFPHEESHDFGGEKEFAEFQQKNTSIQIWK